ncbi:MAG: TonB-dependent receptor, partial [Bryobacteraceae bacterium]
MNKLRRFLICVCGAICMMSQAHAQLTTATVSGIVTDASGAAIPGANLRLESLSRGVARTAVAGPDGRFSFDFVAVGAYRLTVSQTGFNNAVRSGLELSAGQVMDLPIQLEIQQQTQSVDVSAEVAVLDTTTAEQVAALNDAQVHDLPVDHLDWSNLLTDSTGSTKPPAVTSLNSTSPGGSGVNINGLPSAGYNFTVDGTNASNNTVFTAYNVYQGVGLINAVNNDSIEEVSSARGTPPATVGGGMSGNINIVTKGGTNEYHGSLHELNEVSVFDARNQFLTARPRTTFNDYGVSAGLPILKNKLFFFGSYEGAALTTAKAITGGVPSPYLLSIAPAVYTPLFSLFPQAPQPAGSPTATTSQYFGAASNVQKDDNGVYRLDYYINQSNIIAVRYIRSRPDATSPALLAANARHYYDLGDAVNVTYTRSSAHWTENTRAAFNNVNMDRIDNLLSDPNFGNVTFGWSSAGSKDLHWWGNYTTFQEGVAYVHGRQTIQFGGIVERQKGIEIQITPVSISYSSLTQFLNDAPSTMALALHSFPSGQQPTTNIRYQYGEYLQDDVKVSNDLTLNLGLRYDIWTVPTEVQNRIFNRYIDPNNPQLGFGFGPIINQYYRPD